MATINLGRIKPVFQGAYNAGTAYVVDDIVTFEGQSFICILASTGNATSNATYWTLIAKKGADVTQLTTHGDFLFRDGTGVQRLAAGSSGQVLVTKGASANPEWASANGIVWDYRNASFTAVSGGAYICNTGEVGAFTITLPAEMTKENVEDEVMKHEKTQQYMAGKSAKKIIVVPNRIINVVI